MEAIKTVGLTKCYGNLTAVSSLDLSIEEGEIFALLGVNGAGKSTAIKMLSCITTPTDGDAYVGGFSILRNRSEVKSIIGVSPQETAVAHNLTVYENLELMCGVYGMDKNTSRVKISNLSDRFGLTEILSKRAGKLSGGWQRRLSIAMSLIGSPRVLFLDEPTLGLDVISRRELWELIASMRGAVTIILTTHYMEEAESLADRIGIMKNGRLLTVGTAREIMDTVGEDKFESAFIKVVKSSEGEGVEI